MGPARVFEQWLEIKGLAGIAVVVVHLYPAREVRRGEFGQERSGRRSPGCTASGPKWFLSGSAMPVPFAVGGSAVAPLRARVAAILST